MNETAHHILLLLKDGIFDVEGHRAAEEAGRYLGLHTGKVKKGKLFSIVHEIKEREIHEFAHFALKDVVLHDVYINTLYQNSTFQSFILVSKLPGVTDDEGVSAQKTLCDLLDMRDDAGRQFIFSHDLYYLEHALPEESLRLLAEELLGNPLVNHFQFGLLEDFSWYVPTVSLASEAHTAIVEIDLPDEELVALSKRMLLSLNLAEMKAIRAYYENPAVRAQRAQAGLSPLPTDCELEVLGQTWSEHCKHKEFNATITYTDLDTGEVKTIDSLFNTFIAGATGRVKQKLEAAGEDWLLKVFSDNAGVVRIDEKSVFIWKVETHNSPSALDPYGGALTGIVGVNRDPLGTGVGGGRLLFNTNVLCFGDPFFSGRLVKGQLHPRRILAGVVQGIQDGGNKSGIPTVNGSVVFDHRFMGKPLVFCGTGAVMPASYQGRNSWEKRIDPGDRIVMAGGRVGRDGIHGATFSSLEIDEHSPRSAVQIGSPITQKNLSDFMQHACVQGLVKSSTDNGAGGLSSSVGELAGIPGGAVVHLDKVPLKYPGLKPWEIFVSESQERMTLVVEPMALGPLFELAAQFEVELSDIGWFTSLGVLDVQYEGARVAYLGLDFLHDGVPKKELVAEWKRPSLAEPVLPHIDNYNQILTRLLGSLNICSREPIIRRYDHEVKGRSVVKPLMGPSGKGPQDAAVLRLSFDSYEGIAVSNGILPRYGDIDAYAMSAGAFDEAMRQIIAVGGRLPDPGKGSPDFWSVNDNFCVPDSVYEKKTNPDGKLKLAKLVRMCQALYDMSTFFNIPMTSGKDSMKNDFQGEGVKISVPPTILYSMVAKIPDVRRVTTAELKHAGDLIYLVGTTYDELGGSEFYRLFEETGANVPVVRKENARRIYDKLNEAQNAGLVASCHDLSDGGLAVGLAEAAMGGDLGCDVTLPDNGLGFNALLFSESHSRFIVSVRAADDAAFQAILGEDCSRLGDVSSARRMVVRHTDQVMVDIELTELMDAWSSGLGGVV